MSGMAQQPIPGAHIHPRMKALTGLTVEEMRERLRPLTVAELEEYGAGFEATLRVYDTQVMKVGGVAVNATGLLPEDMARAGLAALDEFLPVAHQREAEEQERRAAEAEAARIRKRVEVIEAARPLAHRAMSAEAQREDAYRDGNALIEQSFIGAILEQDASLTSAGRELFVLLGALHDDPDGRQELLDTVGESGRRALGRFAPDHSGALPGQSAVREDLRHRQFIDNVIYNLGSALRAGRFNS